MQLKYNLTSDSQSFASELSVADFSALRGLGIGDAVKGGEPRRSAMLIVSG